MGSPEEKSNGKKKISIAGVPAEAVERRTCQHLWIVLSVLVCITALLISSRNNRSEDELQILSEDGRRLMLKYDYDKNLVLSVPEVRDLLQDILGLTYGGAGDENEFDEGKRHEVMVMQGAELVNVSATFEGIHLDSMSQKKMDEGFGAPEFDHSPCFNGLINWTAPHILEKEFLAKQFCDFFSPGTNQIGEIYWIIPPPRSETKLSSLRYKPPPSANKNENFLASLLGMFHPNVFTIMRFAPRGVAAVMTAQSQHYVEVQFRIHAEFQLNINPLPQFWFTPGRFEGHVIISKDTTQCHVRDFFLELPTESSLNVDMEWVNEEASSDDNSENLEVDIGFVSAMSLQTVSPSSPVVLHEDDGTLIDRRDLRTKGEDIHFEYEPIEWIEEIGIDDARHELEKAFFPFTKIKYLPLADAFAEARLQNKPVHQVVLWGALNDQSC